jgi:hypothetical protein
MKLLLQILLAIILHPVATVLCFVNLLGRDDIGGGKKIIWALVSIVPIGPILYVTIGDGALW